jgi:hypothetical protein
MTKLLEEAFAAAARLTPGAQDALAAAIFLELKTEPLWDPSFGKSLQTLERLADEALREERAGRTQPLDPDAF